MKLFFNRQGYGSQITLNSSLLIINNDVLVLKELIRKIDNLNLTSLIKLEC